MSPLARASLGVSCSPPLVDSSRSVLPRSEATAECSDAQTAEAEDAGGPPNDDFRFLVERVLAAIVEAHDRELETVRRGGVLADAPGPEHTRSAPMPVPGRREQRLGSQKGPARRGSAGSTRLAACALTAPSRPGSGGKFEEQVSADKALREARDMGLLTTSSKAVKNCWVSQDEAPRSQSISTASTAFTEEALEHSTSPKWQWMHRTGWRDYKQEETAHLERTFQDGYSKARLKSGKQGRHHPMEIFFADMLQHDTSSRKVRSVRRQGPDPWWQRLRRLCLSCYRSWETGRPRMESFEAFYHGDIHRCDLLEEQGKASRRSLNVDGPEMERRKRRAGRFKKFADSNGFSWFMMVMIVVNSIWVAIETDHNQADNLFEADAIFQVFENTFGAVFAVEMTVRFLSFARTFDAILDKWFVFDSLCTLAMITEIWIVPLFSWLVSGQQDAASGTSFGLFRLARLLRVTRIGRLVPIIPGVITLLKGLSHSLKPVMVSTVLLSILILLFAIVFRSQVKGTWLGRCCWAEEQCQRCDGFFHSVPETVLTLLFNGTLLDDVKAVVDIIRRDSLFLSIVFTVYTLITNCAVLNMLLGIICGVVAEVKEKEKEKKDKYQLTQCLSDIMEVYDKDGTKVLHKDEFDLFITNPEVRHVLTEFQVDAWGLRTFMDVYAASLAEDSPEELNGEDPMFPFEEILDIVLRLRGGGGASVSDIVNLRRFTGQRLDSVESKVQELYQRATWSVS